jgi:pre-mRNA-splicing factor SYF1
MFERARDVYEEGLTSVVTVRDFSLVYDALTQVRRGWGDHFSLAVLPRRLGQGRMRRRATTVAPPKRPRPPCLPQFEESLISAKMEAAAEEEGGEEGDDENDGQDFLLKDSGDDLDLRWAARWPAAACNQPCAPDTRHASSGRLQPPPLMHPAPPAFPGWRGWNT